MKWKACYNFWPTFQNSSNKPNCKIIACIKISYHLSQHTFVVSLFSQTKIIMSPKWQGKITLLQNLLYKQTDFDFYSPSNIYLQWKWHTFIDQWFWKLERQIRYLCVFFADKNAIVIVLELRKSIGQTTSTYVISRS